MAQVHAAKRRTRRRDDIVLSRAQFAPRALDLFLLDLAVDIAPAAALLGDDERPKHLGLARDIAELPEDADPRDLLRRFLEALLHPEL